MLYLRPMRPGRFLDLAAIVCVSCLLASCISVGDFGTYWDKGTIDPALAGTWSRVPDPATAPDPIPEGSKISFVREGTSYTFHDTDGTTCLVRSMRIGRHAFMMMRRADKPDGILLRYDFQTNDLRMYFAHGADMLRFVETRHPGVRNIAKNQGEGSYAVVKTLDPEAISVLSEMADDPSFWELAAVFRKWPRGVPPCATTS
jgi:hypothetical protein